MKALTSSSICLSCSHTGFKTTLLMLCNDTLSSAFMNQTVRDSILQCLNTGTDLNVTAVEAQVRARAEQRTIQQELITAGYCPTVKAAGETGAHPGHKHHRLRNYRTRINPCWFLPLPPCASHGVQSTK